MIFSDMKIDQESLGNTDEYQRNKHYHEGAKMVKE